MTVLSTRSLAPARRAASLAYATYGRGAPLLFIHDVGESGEVWLPFVRPLASHYCLIVPDLRGHGRSADLPRAESMSALVEDLRELLDAFQLGSCVVIGHGAGGAIAARLARDEPQRVQGVAVIRACPPQRLKKLRARIRGLLPMRQASACSRMLEIAVDGPLHHQVASICTMLLPWLERVGNQHETQA